MAWTWMLADAGGDGNADVGAGMNRFIEEVFAWSVEEIWERGTPTACSGDEVMLVGCCFKLLSFVLRL